VVSRPERAVTPSRPVGAVVCGDDPLEAALGVIDRMLARGDDDAAARTLAGHLARRLDSARAGVDLPRALGAAAAVHCAALLEQTGDPQWFDAILEVHLLTSAPMAEALTARIAPFVSIVPAASQERLAVYQNLIRERLGEVDASDLEACEQILTLGA
jgi:hypothetical protein